MSCSVGRRGVPDPASGVCSVSSHKDNRVFKQATRSLATFVCSHHSLCSTTLACSVHGVAHSLPSLPRGTVEKFLKIRVFTSAVNYVLVCVHRPLCLLATLASLDHSLAGLLLKKLNMCVHAVNTFHGKKRVFAVTRNTPIDLFRSTGRLSRFCSGLTCTSCRRRKRAIDSPKTRSPSSANIHPNQWSHSKWPS